MSNASIEQWNKAAGAFSEEQEKSEFSDMNKAAVKERFTSLSGEKVLDLGCGYGYYTDYFRSIGGEVTGVDGAPAMIDIAKEKYPGGIGTITCYNSRTLLRQTIVLLILNNNRSWGWINMTMAPLRTTDSPSVAISDTKVEKGLDNMIVKHCKCLMKMAERRKARRSIDGMSSAEKLEHSEHEDYWKNKKTIAEAFMKERQSSTKVLIEVAAQHPLDEGLYPNEEFQKRLDMAIRLCHDIGSQNVWFYVPGSRHMFNGVADEVSLSEAGKNYLLQNGIDEEHIYANEANYKYKGEQGVYNSADESFVASCIFKNENFGQMICVCSPYQTMRKSFYYLEFGLIPQCYGIPGASMFHDPISEYFGSLHHTVMEDHSWQDEKSEAAVNSRKSRMAKP